MKQRRVHKRTEREDDGLESPTAPLSHLSTDTVINSSTHRDGNRVSASGCTAIHTIRDTFSGCSMAIPQRTHDTNANYVNLKFFGGHKCSDPHVLVKSDAAKELTKAVSDLGWHPEP